MKNCRFEIHVNEIPRYIYIYTLYGTTWVENAFQMKILWHWRRGALGVVKDEKKEEPLYNDPWGEVINSSRIPTTFY